MRGGAGHVAMLLMRELTTVNPRNALQSVAGGEGGLRKHEVLGLW